MRSKNKGKAKEWLRAVIDAAVILLIMFVFLWPTKVEGAVSYTHLTMWKPNGLTLG